MSRDDFLIERCPACGRHVSNLQWHRCPEAVSPPSPTSEQTSLDDMIHCAARELSYRQRVYPRRVAAGVMPQDLADREITRMKAILERLYRDQREGR